MFRGFVIAICPHCGHQFKAPDFEHNATIYSEPVRCPRCGKLVQIGIDSGPSLFCTLLRKIFK